MPRGIRLFVGQKVRQLRLDARMDQAAMARLLGISVSYLSQLENDDRPLTAKVTVSLDRRKHVVEARISSGGEHLEAHEVSDDMYASIDRVMAKLERQIRVTKGTARARRHDADSLKDLAPVIAAAAAGAKPGPSARRPKKKTKKKAAVAKRATTAR